MKTSIAFTILCIVATDVAIGSPDGESTDKTSSSMRAPSESPHWTLQVDPLTTALGYVHVQVERTLNDRLSIYVGPHLRLFKGLLSEEDDDFLGVGVEAGVRLFFRGGAPRGFWAQVRGVAARISTDDDATVGGYGSVLGGYTFILADRWVFALGLGVQYIHYTIDSPDGELGTKGVLPAAHTTVGIAF